MLTKIQKLEKFFIAYLLINPLLDLFGGIYLHIGSTLAEETLVNMITPVLPLRMVVLLLFAVYALLITDKQTIFTLLPIGGAWLLSLAGEFLFATEFSLFSDMQYIAKYVYNLAVLLVYWRVLQRCQLSKEQILAKLNWYIAVTLTILSGSILLAYVFGLGYATYGDRWGISGSRGFFYSGNDITAILMLLLPLSIAAYLLLPDGLSRRQKLFWLFPPAGTIAAMLIISTKTSFLAIGIVVLTFLIFTLVEGCKTHGYRLLKRFGVVMLSFSVVFLVITLFSQAAIFLDLSHSIKKLRLIREGSGLDGLLFSGRQDLLADCFNHYRDGGIFTWLCGLGRGTQPKLIEMDLFEVLFYYGLLGAAAMLWLYAKVGVDFLKNFFRQVDTCGVACFVSLGMTVAYLIIAGHVLFSVSSGFYFALVLLYGKLYYAKSADPVDFNLFARQPKKIKS